MTKKGGNPQNFNNPVRQVAATPITVRLRQDIDEYVRSQPEGATEWVRRAIAEKMQREQAQAG